MSANRVVVALTPIFVGLAGTISAWAAVHLPGGPQLDEGLVVAVFVAGAAAALSAGQQWLKGWQAHEAREAGLNAAERAQVVNRSVERAVELAFEIHGEERRATEAAGAEQLGDDAAGIRQSRRSLRTQ